MNVLVLGATGRTGRLFVAEALRRGHRVTAIARDPAKLPGTGATIVQGTPYDGPTVERALGGCDAVVNVLNISRRSDNPWAPLAAPKDLISRACAHALRAMERSGARRYLTLSTVGASESWKELPLPLRLFVRASNLRFAFDDHTVEERLLGESAVDYTIVRAPMLTMDERPAGVGVTRPGERMAKGTLRRRSVAELLVALLEGDEHRREVIHVCDRP